MIHQLSPGLDSQTYQFWKNFLNFVTGCLSIFGCTWVFWNFFKTHQKHSIVFKLVLAISISDFIYSVTNIMTTFDYSNEVLCFIEGILRVISVTSALYFASAIAVWAYFIFSKRPNLIQRKLFFKWIIILGCVLPLFTCLIPFITGGYYRYGYQSFGCYVAIGSINPSSTAKLILILLFDGLPVSLALGVTIRAYRIIVRMWEQNFLLIHGDISVKKLFWYPAVLFLVYIPSFIDNIIQIYLNSGLASFILTVIHIILTHTVGLSNAIVYGCLRLISQND